MALQIVKQTQYGIDLPEAYAKVMYVSYSYPGPVTAIIEVYADEQARQDGKTPVDHIQVQFPLDFAVTDNIVKQVYDHAKTLDQFTGALDV